MAPHDHWVLKYHTLTNTALLFNFILQYILWPPHYHWVLKYHTLTNNALLFNFILQYILWPPHDHWVLKYLTLTNTALLFNFILQYILWPPHDHWWIKRDCKIDLILFYNMLGPHHMNTAWWPPQTTDSDVTPYLTWSWNSKNSQLWNGTSVLLVIAWYCKESI